MDPVSPREVVVVEPTGADTQVYCTLSDADITVVSRERHDFRPGDDHRCSRCRARAYLFDRGRAASALG